MSGEFPFSVKIVSPVKCNEKPWDLWVSEIGHLSPRQDEEPPAEAKGARRAGAHKERGRRRRAVTRLRHDAMSLHGLLPQMDNLNAAVCHMCGVVVKCSAAHRHLLESHTETEPILPPPAAPTVKLKVLKSRSKKEAPPPLTVDLLPVKMETSPVHTATAPLSRIVLPQPELYLEEAGTSAPVTGEVQVCIESGELPVVSIQDTEDLPLGENITEDIFEIMNSEGIQRADDLSNPTDWKNIIRDIGNMQDINFSQTTDTQSQDMYSTVDSTLPAYTITEPDLASLQFATNTVPLVPSVLDSLVTAGPQQAPKPAPSLPTTPSTKSSRAKTSKTKFNLREYDPNKHCGVVTAENPKPCTRSLTCKAHALSLRRTVDGRCKPFDTLLAEHRAARDAAAAPPPDPAAAYAALTEQQRVDDIYASLLSVEESAMLPDSALTSLLSQPLPAELLLPEEAEPAPAGAPSAASPAPPRRPEPAPAPADVCWYSTCPRPLALCTFNASHAGGAVALGKRYATVRSNIKSSLSRSQCKATGGTNNYYYNQNALSLKTVHMNASKTNKPEVRKLVVTCGGRGAAQQSLGELLGERPNGHVGRPERRPLKHKRPPQLIDLGFSLDPLLADEKC